MLVSLPDSDGSDMFYMTKPGVRLPLQSLAAARGFF